MADIDYNALGQALDTSWGRSSTPQSASFSVKMTMLGPDRLMASYTAIVNFASERQRLEMKKRYESEAKAVTAAVLKTVKGNYKQLAGSTLTTKELSSVDSIEIIDMNVHTPRRLAYFRLKVVYEIG